MELILWRHADAEDPGPKGDAARALTKKGRKQAERIAAWLHPRLEGEWTVLSSPAVRAVQTVDALGAAYETRDALDTSCRVEDVLREAGWPGGDRVIVVGHQPTLGEVAARLLGTTEEIAFRKGAIWWFATRDREDRRDTVLKVVMDPEMLEEGAK
ncbi:MAG TPA: histidine phosphatase family protein [Usitatibacter sp.]|nr:histidine phosphatase family protein [Usitatibacter sp.]